MAVRVSVDAYGIASIRMAMSDKDTIKDIKQMVEQMTGIDHKTIKVQHGTVKSVMKTLDDDDTIGNFVRSLLDGLKTAKFYLTSPTLDALKVANKLKSQQLEADEKGAFVDGELTINKDYVILTAHKWDDWTPELPQPKIDPVASSSSEVQGATATSADDFIIPAGMDDKKEMMTALQKTNAELEAFVKDNKEKIKKLRDAIRASPIKIWLMRPSGEKFDITTQPDFTISRLKKSIDNVYGFDRHFARLISNDASGAPVEMKNGKRLFSYTILSDGDEIFLVMTGGNNIPTPATDEQSDADDGSGYNAIQAPVVQQSSSDEDETGTPYMSDADVPQEPKPNPLDMVAVAVKDFTSKQVRFFGKVDGTMTLDAFLDYILTFEDLTEEQLERLQFTNDRGSSYDPSITIKQAMSGVGFSGFYISVKGLAGGAGVKMSLTKRNAKIQQLNFRIETQKKELNELKKSDYILEAQAIVEKFSTMSEKDAIQSIKGYIGGNSLENLLKMQVVLSADDKNKPEVKVRNCASAFFGEKLVKIEKDCETMTALIAVGKSVLETAYISGCVQNDKFNLGAFRKIVDEAVIFKQGQKSSSSQAVDALANQLADTRME